MFGKIVKISFRHSTHTKFCIIGGGTGGVNTACHLLREQIRPEDIRIFEPSQYHYYQPGWTMVGNNIFDAENTRKLTRDVVPEDTHLTV